MDSFRKAYYEFMVEIINVFPEYGEAAQVQLDAMKRDDIQDVIFHYLKHSQEVLTAIIMLDKETLAKAPEAKHMIPGVDFSAIVADDTISETTMKAVFRHLQTLYMLALKHIQQDVSGNSFTESFAEFMRGFEDNEKWIGDAQKHAQALMSIVEALGGNGTAEDGTGTGLPAGLAGLAGLADGLPNLQELLSGKIGKLAQEISQDIQPSDLGIDPEKLNAEKPTDVLNGLMKNSGKLMNVVKKVGEKVQQKIAAGEINQQELMEEAQDLMEKIQNSKLGAMMNKMTGGQFAPGGAKARQTSAHARLRKKLDTRNNATSNERISDADGAGGEAVQPSIEELMQFIESQGPSANKNKNKKKSKK